MSLNRSEQRVFDYLERHPDERLHWQEKVQRAARNVENDHVAVVGIESELWRYYLERSAVAPVFREAARTEGLARTSMKNLAELMLRLWVEPRPKKKAAEAE